MEGKAYALIAIALVAGLAGGYVTSSMSFQNQVLGLQLQVSELQTNYTKLQTNYTAIQNQYNQLLTNFTRLQNNYITIQTHYDQLLANYTGLQTQYNELLANYTKLITQPQVRIDAITWNIANNNCIVVVRNTGSIAATIESIAIRLSGTSTTFYWQSYTSSNSINAGTTVSFTWTESGASAPADFLKPLTEYVVRVTTTTGFQYEMAATSPSS